MTAPARTRSAPDLYAYLIDRAGRECTDKDIANGTGYDLTKVQRALGRMVRGRYGNIDSQGRQVTQPFPGVERVAEGIYRYTGPGLSAAAPTEAPAKPHPLAGWASPAPKPTKDRFPDVAGTRPGLGKVDGANPGAWLLVQLVARTDDGWIAKDDDTGELLHVKALTF